MTDHVLVVYHVYAHVIGQLQSAISYNLLLTIENSRLQKSRMEIVIYSGVQGLLWRTLRPPPATPMDVDSSVGSRQHRCKNLWNDIMEHIVQVSKSFCAAVSLVLANMQTFSDLYIII